MSYTTLTIIVEGALDFEQDYPDSEAVERERKVGEAALAARDDGLQTDVFLLHHDHDELGEDDECACAQYVTDHHPAYSFPRDLADVIGGP